MDEPTIETLAQRLERVERENRRLKRAGVISLIAVVLVLASGTFLLVRYEQRRRLDQLVIDLEQTAELVGLAFDKLLRREKELSELQGAVDKLTTKEVVDRLKHVDGRIDRLTGQVNSLQQIISPENVSEILTVARMKEEILARRKFEGRVKGRLEEFGKGIEKTDGRLWTIQLWIWGTLVAVIGGLLGVAFYLGRRFERAPKEGGTGGGAS